jgi:hypothetical protein
MRSITIRTGAVAVAPALVFTVAVALNVSAPPWARAVRDASTAPATTVLVTASLRIVIAYCSFAEGKRIISRLVP